MFIFAKLCQIVFSLYVPWLGMSLVDQEFRGALHAVAGRVVFAVRLASSPGVASLRGVYIWRGGWFPGGQPLFSLPWSGYRGLLVVQALPSSLYF